MLLRPAAGRNCAMVLRFLLPTASIAAALNACSDGPPEVTGNVKVVEGPSRSATATRQQQVAPPLPPATTRDDSSDQSRKDFVDPPLPTELLDNASKLVPLPPRPSIGSTASGPSV